MDNKTDISFGFRMMCRIVLITKVVIGRGG